MSIIPKSTDLVSQAVEPPPTLWTHTMALEPNKKTETETVNLFTYANTENIVLFMNVLIFYIYKYIKKLSL